MSYSVNWKIPRSTEDSIICSELAQFGVATVSECQDKQGVMDPGIRPVVYGKSVSGVAVTVKCFDADNLMLHAAIGICARGDILVVSTNSQTRNGYFGELMATSSISRGIIGVVIDGGLRDTRRIRDLGFPSWSRYISVTGTSKTNPGWVNVPVVCGGIGVSPGDYIVADDDGVAVVPRGTVQEVIARCKSRVIKEEEVRKRLANGELSIDIYNLNETIKKIGVKNEVEK
ncbi:MAG: 4-carboxy-4-hydroxy-2-oxoadipate aldolase/oxaloacetate decarboxylase [Thermoplasmatales archaeon]